MPPINHAVLASAGIIAVSIAVAAAIAVYESPELRRMAEDLRRRIAVALHSLGDNVNPGAREPAFNRPEDAEGFLQSRGVFGADPGVDADEETRRRQREELMYWNAVLAAKKEKEKSAAEEADAKTRPTQSRKGSSFDDFLQEDKSAERGTFVFNTGADLGGHSQSLIRRRVPEGVRGLNASLYANPFGDEHGIVDSDDQPTMEANILSPGKDEGLSDIYNATEPEARTAASVTLSPQPAAEVLFDFDSPADPPPAPLARPLIERELGPDEYMTAGQDSHHQDAYASIQAWAQNSNPGFYSPLPMSPPAPLSEPEVISNGALTPTDSVSLIGSGEDTGDGAESHRAGEGTRYYDVMSEDEDGMTTPASWTEVGSVVSESEGAVHA